MVYYGDIYDTEYIEVWSYNDGLRPIFHLSKSVKIKDDGGDGSSAKPFVLE